MKCAYCNKDKKPTREHIIPDGFLRGMNKDHQIRWSEAVPSRVIKSDFVIKDVCADCNNGVLSQLDDYAIIQIKDYQGKISKDTKKIFFKYNYNKLSRWLLKICFNSARANKCEYDINVYKNCIPYIINNKKISSKISIYGLFMDLSINGQTHDFYHFDSESKYSIDVFRIAPFKLKDISTYNCSMRIVMINSFAFLVIVYDEGTDQKKIKEIEETIINGNYNFKKLQGNSKVKLIKDKTLWEYSIYSNIIRRDSFWEKREVVNDNINYYIIQISKEEILGKNFMQVEGIASKRNNKENVIDNYQKFIILISGYDNDRRELFCIPEFKNYIKAIIDNFPEIIWFMNLEMSFFEAMFLAYINDNNTLNIDNRIILNNKKGIEFMEKCFSGINKLINNFALDHSYNDKITKLFNDKISSILHRPIN